MKRLLLLACVLVLAGCGGDEGSATLWVTRDRGAHVLLVAQVPAGLTAMQALEQEAHVDTSYGGRFVNGINGVESRPQHDWFYYVNGIALGRSAVEYRLHDGDIEWWDYTEWRRPNEYPAVVGGGPVAHALAKLVHGRVAQRAPRGANTLELRAGGGFHALTPSQFVIDPALALRLVENPHAFRYRYAVT